MYAVIAFDTEDVYYPPERRIDDVPGWLASTLTEHGLRGTFFVTAEKARSMRERGRTGVLSEMGMHDIASHTRGNVRPLLPQVLEHCGWHDGVDAMRTFEDGVATEIRSAFGKDPIGISRHNVYWAAQHVAVGGERGLPHMYSPARHRNHVGPTWYAGAITFSQPQFAGLDRIYAEDEPFEERMAQLATFLDELERDGAEYATMFACHPVQVMAHGWLEHYCLASGDFRTPEEVGWLYPTRSAEEEARAKANFAKYARYLKERPGLRVVGLEEAGKLFSYRPAAITRDELAAYASQVVEAGKPLTHETHSPAELLCGLAESLAAHGERDELPGEVTRRDVLGPVERPVVGREMRALPPREVVPLATGLMAYADAKGHLPAHLSVPDGRLGTGQLLHAFARRYKVILDGEAEAELPVEETARYPEEARQIDGWVRSVIGEHWGMPLDFTVENIAEHARLQTWTLKPARLAP